MYEDKILVCRDCGNEFTFTVGEQEFFARMGFQNEPVRCKECRVSRRRQRDGERVERRMYPVICAECGCEAEVPFKPTSDRPVYCRDCFMRKREQQII